MSLRWRFLGAFTLIILLAVSLSVGVGFYTTQGQLNAFVRELSRVEANNIAQNLSQAYTTSGGWESAATTLAEAGYFYNEGAEHEEGGENEREGDEGGDGIFHIDRIRIVVVDNAGMMIQDNFSLLTTGEAAPDLDGQQMTILDLDVNQAVGYAYVDVNREFLATESGGFLSELLTNSALGGLLITTIALLLAVWLSRRITAPVTALTKATQAIAQYGDTAMLPITSSDELGQMSAAFNQMTTALQTQRTLRKRLIDDVSHELNTPLSVIRLEAHGLRKGLQTPDRAADQIIQEVDMLHNLVSDLNWLAESELEALQLMVEPCSIPQLLAAEVERWQPQAQNHKIALSLRPLPLLPSLNLDQMRMRQALGNVINNALQHTEAGGQVVVAAMLSTNEDVEISVTDDGAGIETAVLPHIFNRFYRADQSRNRRTGGMGLGLPIARTIVEAHGGTISITSDGVDQGTTVCLRVPSKSLFSENV